MEDIIRQIQDLLRDTDEDEVGAVIVALMAGFCVTYGDDEAEALFMLMEMHGAAAELVMFEDDDEVLH